MLCKTHNIGKNEAKKNNELQIQCWCKIPNIGEDPSEEHQQTTDANTKASARLDGQANMPYTYGKKEIKL